jgi:hypothetical protein
MRQRGRNCGCDHYHKGIVHNEEGDYSINVKRIKVLDTLSKEDPKSEEEEKNGV